MKRQLWMVGALGLGLVIGGAARADSNESDQDKQHDKQDKHKDKQDKHKDKQDKHHDEQGDKQDKQHDKQANNQDKHQDKQGNKQWQTYKPWQTNKPGQTNKPWQTYKPGQELSDIKNAAGNKKAAEKAVKDAEGAKAAAEKAYVDAQNNASVNRGNLGSAQAKLDQAQREFDAAYAANKANGTVQTGADVEKASQALFDAQTTLGGQKGSYDSEIANVAAATAARDKADAALAAAKAAESEAGAGVKRAVLDTVLRGGGNYPSSGGKKYPDKKADNKAVMAAKAAADKAYVDAQNAASVARGQVGSAQAKYQQADQMYGTASYNNAVAPNQTNSDAKDKAAAIRDSSAVEVANAARISNDAIAKVNAATAARDKADADLKSATAGK